MAGIRIDNPGWIRGLSLSLILLAGVANADQSPGRTETQRFRIHVYEDGVYRVDYAQLRASGLPGPVSSEHLGIENRGRPVALRVDDSGDGRFGPGDSMVFVGKHLRGETGYYHEYSPFNVYVLTIGAQTGAHRMSAADPTEAGLAKRTPARLRSTLHLERDLLRAPLAGRVGSYDGETLWYWMQINHLASEPTRIPIDLSHLDREGKSAFSLKLQFRGWSDAARAFPSFPDHVVEISLNGTPIGRGSWQGRETRLIEIPSIPAELARPDHNVLEIRVPSRRHGSDDAPIVDVIYLDWIEAVLPRDSELDDGQERLQLPDDRNTRTLRLVRAAQPGKEPAGYPVSFFGENGFHAVTRGREAVSDGSRRVRVYEPAIPAGEDTVWVVPDDNFRSVPAIELDRPSNLAGSTDQRDYFLIAHGTLAEAVEPLARFHDSRGTSTEIVDVQDIYDEFNYGIKHPRAIRDFLAHARETRQAPAPSLVLLVGDASWYVKEHAKATEERIRYNERNLIPTWQLRSRDGPAASDNPFVMLDGDDVLPEMAIGRFPAARPDEVRSMVNKTVAYMADTTLGAWRSRVVLASDRSRNLAARNSQLSRRASTGGLSARVLLADSSEDGEWHQGRLRSAINEGMLVLHFFGHGGRFMWQTAPSRSGNAGNLFDMEDLDRLQPSTRLPIVLSMSCDTGPFDHPDADSLAEKFLRMGDRGAVAVLAASARNSPSLKFTNSLMDGILHEDTLGAAVQAAKSARLHPGAAMYYNLFGDPALVPARPQTDVSLEIKGRSPLAVEAVVPIDGFAGRAHVEWISESQEAVSEQLSLESRKIILRAPQQPNGTRYERLTIYVWDPESGLDGSGTIALED